MTTIEVRYIVQVPPVPEFLVMPGGGELPLSALPADVLRGIGEEWTEALVAAAHGVEAPKKASAKKASPEKKVARRESKAVERESKPAKRETKPIGDEAKIDKATEMTALEAANVLDLSAWTVQYDLTKRGVLRARKVGRLNYFNRADVEKLRAERAAKG